MFIKIIKLIYLMVKTKILIISLSVAIILSLVIGGVIGFIIFSDRNFYGGDFHRIYIPEKSNIKSSDLTKYVNGGVCEQEYIRKYGERADCYVEDWAINRITFYNGDGKESYEDQDTLTVSQIGCICFAY